MRSRLQSTITLVVLATLHGAPLRAGEAGPAKTALESDPTGWAHITPGANLEGWKRVSIPPGSKLKEKNPWSVDSQTGTLRCDGVGVHENLQYERELGDFILHVEWRFKKLDGGKGYNSGVYVRNSADGKLWHQAQVGNLNVGGLFGNTLVNGQEKRFTSGSNKPQRGKEAGEWNTYELTCKGKDITLAVNGHVTAEWRDCQVPRGQIGLESEGYVIEFRNLRLKELK